MNRRRTGLANLRANFRIEWVVWIIAVAMLLWLVVYPVGMLLIGSFRSGPPGVPSEFTLENHKVFLDPQYWGAVGKSLLVSIGATVIAVLMGVPLAWFVARTNAPFARTLEGLSIGTFLFTPLMGVVAWILLASPKIGLLNTVAVALLGKPLFNIYSFGGYMWVLGIYYSPYPFLIVTGVLKSVDPTLEEAARASGAGIWRTTWKITFPLALPGILASAILVAILSLGNFAIQAALGQGSKLQVLTYTIFRKVTSFPSDYAGAT
ncbi:MAG: ABC transporter permease subunit, partial [Bacillota bacterium]